MLELSEGKQGQSRPLQNRYKPSKIFVSGEHNYTWRPTAIIILIAPIASSNMKNGINV